MDEIEITRLTAQVVQAFASNNRLAAADLPALIATVRNSVSAAIAPETEAPEEVKKPSVLRVRQSIQPDHLVSFEDGRSYKMLKRHLSLRGLTPKAYREKWGLPDHYPMTAPGYSATRSAFAKASGLGQRSEKPPTPEPGRPPEAALEVASPGRVQRPRKPRETVKVAESTPPDETGG